MLFPKNRSGDQNPQGESGGSKLRDCFKAVRELRVKVDDFISGVHNKGDDSPRPTLRTNISALIIDAPPVACQNLYSLIKWNVDQGRIPQEFLKCPDFVEQRDFIENHFGNCGITELLNRVRFCDRKSPWFALYEQVKWHLKSEQLTILSVFTNDGFCR